MCTYRSYSCVCVYTHTPAFHTCVYIYIYTHEWLHRAIIRVLCISVIAYRRRFAVRGRSRVGRVAESPLNLAAERFIRFPVDLSSGRDVRKLNRERRSRAISARSQRVYRMIRRVYLPRAFTPPLATLASLTRNGRLARDGASRKCVQVTIEIGQLRSDDTDESRAADYFARGALIAR